jgi:hypothetical protein
MLSIPVQKNLADYQSKAWKSFTWRMVKGVAAAMIAPVIVAVYFYFVWGIGADAIFPLMLLVSAPGWLYAFAKPEGLYFEVWLPLWIRAHLGNNVVLYEGTQLRFLPELFCHKSKSDDEWKELEKVNGIELWDFEDKDKEENGND